MQTSRRYDPTKDAKFHVSIMTTGEIHHKWTTPRPEWTVPLALWEAPFSATRFARRE
jgi:hypothetical protein